jgi:transcription termination factor Rho
VSDTTDTLPQDATSTPRRSSGLSGMVLAELQTVASGLGITGTTRMRKGELIEAIKAAQGGGGSAAGSSGAAPRRTRSKASDGAGRRRLRRGLRSHDGRPPDPHPGSWRQVRRAREP